MTIVDYLRGKKLGTQLMDPVLDVIHDEFGDAANENYELIIDQAGKVLVKIPSLKKRDQFEFTKLEDYSYPLIMCMNIDELYTEQHFEYITKKFLELLISEFLITVFIDEKLLTIFLPFDNLELIIVILLP